MNEPESKEKNSSRNSISKYSNKKINSVVTVSNISDKDKVELKEILNNHYLFKDKGINAINKLIENIELNRYNGGAELIVQDLFYIVKEGRVQITTKDQTKEIAAKETFGELALLEKKVHEIKIKILEDSSLFKLKGEIFRDIVKKINESELKERLLFLSYVPIFRFLDLVQLTSVASFMYKCEFNSGQKIIKEGDPGESLFIIKEGSVSCTKNSSVIRVLNSKDYFGENALLFNQKRSLTIYSSNKTVCYQITQSMLDECLGFDYREVILKSITKNALRNSKHLKIFEDNYFFMNFYKHHELKTIENNSILIKDGDEPKYLYMVINGDLFIKGIEPSCVINGNNDININPENRNSTIATRGELFGDVKIKENACYEYNIRAKGSTKLLVFNWHKILSSFDFKFDNKEFIDFFSNLYHLKNFKLFCNTSVPQLIKICKLMEKEKFQEKTTIFKEGDIGDKFYLIKKGKLDVFKNGKFVRELGINDCFGELSLLSKNKRSATIEAVTKVTLYSLTNDNFINLIDKKMLIYLSNKISLQDNFNTELKDLFFCKSLGEGKFGNVALVHNNKNFYALKSVSRNKAEKHKILIKYFISERNILLKLDHPFIMKLVRTFKNDEKIFYMLEYINGKTLSKFIESRNEHNIQNVYITQFYLSFLFIVLNYLNNLKICHRDLKPDNIMIDDKGYLKVIDFGTSIELKNYTYTITGTPHYLAPEIIKGNGYSFSCDYWSVGIIAHELFYNYYPFGDKAKDAVGVYKEVFKKDLKLPKNGNALINDLINCLLKKKVNERLCNFEKIKSHPFFKDFNFDEIMDFRAKPPFIPQLNNLKKFDAYTNKYTDYLNKLKQKEAKQLLSNSSSGDEGDDENYSPDWVDVF